MKRWTLEVDGRVIGDFDDFAEALCESEFLPESVNAFIVDGGDPDEPNERPHNGN